MLNAGVFLISGGITGAVLFGSLVLYLLVGKSIAPFVPNAFNFLLLGSVFVVLALGCAVGLGRDSLKRRQTPATGHTTAWLLSASFFSGLAGSLLINATTHCLAFFGRTIGLPLSVVLTALGLFVLLSLAYSTGIAVLKRR